MTYYIVGNYVNKKTGREIQLELYGVSSGIYQARIYAVREYILHAYNDPKSEYYTRDIYLGIWNEKEHKYRYIFSVNEFLNDKQGEKYKTIIHLYLEEYKTECLAQLSKDILCKLAKEVEKAMYDDYLDLFQQPQQNDGSEEDNTNREIEYTPEIENIMEDTVHKNMDRNI